MNNPTPDDLIRLKLVQRRRLVQLNNKDQWTPKDFDDVFYCHQQWIPEQHEWCVPYTALRELAFDARTPDQKAKTLQQVISHFDQSQKRKEQ